MSELYLPGIDHHSNGILGDDDRRCIKELVRYHYFASRGTALEQTMAGQIATLLNTLDRIVRSDTRDLVREIEDAVGEWERKNGDAPHYCVRLPDRIRVNAGLPVPQEAPK